MTADEIIGGVIEREGGYNDDPADKGGPTKYGITAETLGKWLKLGRPATADEVRAMPESTARAIYDSWYVSEPGFTPEKVPFEPLRVQLVDFGVNSGPARATRWLQRVIGVPTTGRMDDRTVEWLFLHRGFLRIVNDALVATRLLMLDNVTDAGIVNKKFEEGLESRALKFVLARA